MAGAGASLESLGCKLAATRWPRWCFRGTSGCMLGGRCCENPTGPRGRAGRLGTVCGAAEPRLGQWAGPTAGFWPIVFRAVR
eukprot:15458962-Alexandrium_andersonii.AAC.1